MIKPDTGSLDTFIEEDKLNRKVKIIMRSERGHCLENYTMIGGNNITVTRYKECVGEILLPLMDLPDWLFKELVKAFVEYNDRNDVIAKSKDYLGGKLEGANEMIEMQKKVNEKLFNSLDNLIKKIE